MVRSFLLIGQSNMAGRGKLTEAEVIDKSRIYTLRNGRWQKMFRPIHSDRSFYFSLDTIYYNASFPDCKP